MTYLLGRETGHMVDFSVITKVRMDHVSIATANNPGDRGFRDLLADAIEPGRSAALGKAFTDLGAQGVNPHQFDIRTAHAGDRVQGSILGYDANSVALVTSQRIIAVDRADLPQIPPPNQEITLIARGGFARESQQQHADPATSRSAPSAIVDRDYER